MSETGKLLLIATPIGNLGDITTRAAEALGRADLVVAEDTRHTGRLLQHLGLHKPLLSYFEGNRDSRLPQILVRLREGQIVALVTDAGSPLVSDPGYELVYACLEAEVPVEALPGPCAAILALQLSGLPPDRVIFDGYLPRKGAGRRERLEAYRRASGTLLLYEAPGRVGETLRDLLDALGDVDAALLREMTKLHEEAIRGPLSHLLERIGDTEIKGEVTLAVRLPKPPPPDLSEAIAAAQRLRREMGMKTKEAATAVALVTGADKKAIYKALTEERP